MPGSRKTVLVRGFAIVLALAASSAVAGAQAQAVFYHIPVDPGAPDIGTAFSTTPYCTTVVGTPTGFNLDFTNSATQALLASACPGTTTADFMHNFAVHFSGDLLAPAAGTFLLTLDTDDGTQVFLNGVLVYDGFVSQGGGPGSISATLNAGPNPFDIKYFENSFGGAFADFGLPTDVTITPPPVSAVPEPGSLVLFGTGLAGLIPILGRVAVRRRRV